MNGSAIDGPERASEGDGRPIDLRGSSGVQVGEGNTQIIYSYGSVTVEDGVAPLPLTTISGSVESPYRGLSSYREQDAPFYFGREHDIDRVLDALGACATRDQAVFVVSGLSGAGKSSLLRAGIIPRLRGAGFPGQPEAAHWPCVVLSPGAEPLDELALKLAVLAGVPAAGVRRALLDDPASAVVTSRQAAPRVLIVADQFEQLFTVCREEQQRKSFLCCLAALTNGPNPAAVGLIGVRADFEALCAEQGFLRDAVQHRFLVTAMTPLQLRQVIAEPARVVGAEVEPTLIDALLDELGATRATSTQVRAGALPLLSYALDTAWRSRTGPGLTLSDYERTGGVQAALARTAQATYDALSAEEKPLARNLFLRLVTVRTNSDDGSYAEVGQRVLRADLLKEMSPSQAAGTIAVIEAFAERRLVTVAAETIELCHDTLLSAWPLVRDDWLAKTRADRIVLSRMHAAAAEWSRVGRDPSFLYAGSLLSAAQDASRSPAAAEAIAPIDHQFLDASRQRQVRTSRLRRGAVAGLAALSIFLSAATVIAIQARNAANTQRDQAVAHSLLTLSESAGDSDAAISKVEALAAWQLAPSAATHAGLLDAAARPGNSTLTTAGTAEILTMSLDPHGKWVVTGDNDGQFLESSLNGPTSQRLLWQSTASISASSTAGDLIGAGDADGRIRIWHASTRTLETKRPESTNRITGLHFAPDQKSLVSIDIDGNLTRWNVQNGRSIGHAQLDPDIWHLDWSPSGRWIVVAGQQFGKVWLIDAKNFRHRTKIPIHASRTTATAIYGNLLLVGDNDGHIEAWNAETRRYLGSLNGSPTSMAFVPDERHFIVGTGSGAVWVYDLAGASREVCDLTGSTSAVSGVAVAPDRRTAISAGADGKIRIWNLNRCIPLTATGNPAEIGPSDVAFQSDRQVVSVNAGHLQIRNLNGSTTHNLLSSVGKFCIIPGSRTAAVEVQTQSGGFHLNIVDLTTGQHSTLFSDGHANVDAIQASPDGRLLAVAEFPNSGGNYVVRIDRLRGQRTTTILRPKDDADVVGIAVSPDGQRITLAWSNGRLELWNIQTARLLWAGSAGTARSQTVFSHAEVTSTSTTFDNGRRLLTGSFGGKIQLWRLEPTKIVPVKAITSAGSRIFSLTVDAQDQAVAAGLGDGTVRIWNLATGAAIGKPLYAQTGFIGGVAFNNRARNLAEVSDGYLSVWDTSYIHDPAATICVSSRKFVTIRQWTAATGQSADLLQETCTR